MTKQKSWPQCRERHFAFGDFMCWSVCTHTQIQHNRRYELYHFVFIECNFSIFFFLFSSIAIEWRWQTKFTHDQQLVNVRTFCLLSPIRVGCCFFCCCFRLKITRKVWWNNNADSQQSIQNRHWEMGGPRGLEIGKQIGQEKEGKSEIENKTNWNATQSAWNPQLATASTCAYVSGERVGQKRFWYLID